MVYKSNKRKKSFNKAPFLILVLIAAIIFVQAIERKEMKRKLKARAIFSLNKISELQEENRRLKND